MGLTKSDIKRLSSSAQRQIRNAEKNKKERETEAPRKYRNNPCDYIMPDGTVRHFDSTKECRRYAELLMLQKAGQICDIMCQVSFTLIPAQRRDDGTMERACKYIADFTYKDLLNDGKTVVEDVKGYRDPNSAGYAKFVIKRKLMLEKFGITVREV